MAHERKTLGIIGGMGPQATCVFMSKVVAHTKASIDQEHIDMIVLNHAGIPDRTEAILSGKTEEITRILINDAKRLEANGAGVIAIPCNTSHTFFEQIQAAISIPIVNMVHQSVIDMKPSEKVGIMATNGTVFTDIYGIECRKLGLQAVYPSPDCQALVMDIIFEQVKKGLSGDPRMFAKVSDELFSLGCEKIILACTELSCYHAENSLDARYTDAMDALIRKCIEVCGGIYIERH